MADTRDARGYPTRGGVYRASWTRYSDRTVDTFSFRRYEAEAAHSLPFVDDNVVVALHGWLVGTESDASQIVPFYLTPSLGGGNTLRGYSNYRFHDRNLAMVSAETRVAVFEHIDAAVFFDAGNVAAKFDDLDLNKTSYGVGVRLHSEKATFARVDVARSVEGWQVLFRVNDPFRLARFTKRTALIPFAP
jgi:outer membrane protein assembly factor BamA